MHFVGLALEPFEKPAHAIPAIVLREFLDIGVAVARFAVDDEILIGFRQILEGNAHVDLFAGAGPQQVLLRFAKLLASKGAHHAAGDAQAAIGNRAVQIDRDRPAEAAACRTGAERIVETEESGRRRTDIEIAMRAMPAGGERNFGFRIADCGRLSRRFDDSSLSGFRFRFPKSARR